MDSQPHQKRVPLLAAIGMISLVAMAIMVILVASVQAAAALREEAGEAILLAEMEAELQTTAAHADAFAAVMMESPESPHPDFDDHPDVVTSIKAFSTIAAGLRPLLDEQNRVSLDEMIATHIRYTESVAGLHPSETTGGDVMTVYHGESQKLEAEIHNTLSEMRYHESEEIQAAIVASTRAETLMLWLVPALFVLALLIAVYALRLQADRRKSTIRMLRRTNAEKDEFLATVSHELRTPLTSVLGFIDILESDGDSLPWEERQTMLHLASREAWELSNLVEDLLVMARADSGTLSIADVRVNLGAQAAQVVEGIEESPHVIHEAGGPVTAQGNPARVRQIIRNLLTNAFRYGGDQVQIHIEADNDTARLQVIDDGAGIPEDQQQEIFEAYHRVDPDTSPDGSVGLGLAVSRRLARAMGGDLTYRYQADHSIFELNLQTALSPATAPDPVLSSTAP